jgi:hypothetical protein
MKKELLPWEKRYQCSICGDFFKSWDDAQYHMNKVHARPDLPVDILFDGVRIGTARIL